MTLNVERYIWQGKRVLVTGATGFIGSELVERLVIDGAHVAALTRRKPHHVGAQWIQYSQGEEFPSKQINEFNPNTVFHLATKFIPSHNASDVVSLIESNIEFGTQLLETLGGSPATFINVNSAWQHYRGEDYSPVSLYAATKQAFRDIAQFYASVGLDVRNLTIFDTYGPHDQRNKLVSQLLSAANSGEAIEMGTGNQLINLVFVSDVIGALMQLAQRNKTHSSLESDYVARANASISIKELVSQVEKVTGKSVHAKWGMRPERDREMQQDWVFGSSLPDWRPRIALNEGLHICWKAITGEP